MADFTVQKLYDRVRTTLNLPRDDETTYPPEEIVDLVNAAYGFIEVTDEILLHIEPGVRRYLLPDSWLETQFVTLSDALPGLLPFHPKTFVQAGMHNQTGRPTHYAEDGQYINLWPVPSSATTMAVYGRMNPEEVSSLEDVIPLAKAYRDALAYFVVGMCLTREGDAQSSYYLELWNSFLTKAATADARKRNRQHTGPSSAGSHPAAMHFISRRR